MAVITSGCPDSACSSQEYSLGVGDQVAAEKFFKDLGMAPKHFDIRVDNYKQTANIFSFRGYQYYFLFYQVDIFYFNGGDQSYHIRSWLNDDGQPSPIFSEIRGMIVRNQAVVMAMAEGAAALTKTIFGGGSTFGMMYFAQNTKLAPNTIASNHGLVDVRNGTGCLQSE